MQKTEQTICLGCGEPIAYYTDWKEWHTTAEPPKEHYVNVCAYKPSRHASTRAHVPQ